MNPLSLNDLDAITPLDLSTSGATYRPIPSTHTSYSAFARSAASVHEAPAQPSGALSALSTILLGQPQRPSQARSLLERRRGLKTEERFNLGTSLEDLRSTPSRWPTGQAPAARPRPTAPADLLAERDGDVPRLEEEMRAGRRRERSGDGEASEEDLPPSPVGLPGGWSWDAKSSSLLLPPPFLDQHSSADSFEGLLGTKTEREKLGRERKLRRLIARDRPPPPAFPQSLFATASKLVTALGPPGGLDSGPMYRKWKDDPDDKVPRSVRQDRRRLERAESGLRGFDLGERIGVRLAEKLRRERGPTEEAVPRMAIPREDSPSTVKAATPMSFLLSLDDDYETQQPAVPSVPSPPLSSFSPESPFFDTPSSTATSLGPPRTPSLVPIPPKPKLGPIFDEAEPSPFPFTPHEPPVPVPADQDDYFAIRRRRGSRPRPTSLIAEDSNPEGSATSITHSPARLFPSPSPSQPNRAVFAVGNALGSALRGIESRRRAHLDLIVWVLVGAPRSADGLSGVGGFAGVVLHLFGFSAFVLVHTLSLLVSTYATLRSVLVFLHWTFLNLTGRTDLSIVAAEYFTLCRNEWDKVAVEDGVALGVWSVLVGLAEIAAIQAMSGERWIGDQTRLSLLNGEEEQEEQEDEPAPQLLRRRSTKRRSNANGVGIEHPGLGRRRTTRTWTEDDGEGDSLLVTRGEGTILEGTILNSAQSPTLAALSPSFTASSDQDDPPPFDLGDALPGFSFSPSSPRSSAVSSAPLSMMPSSPPLRPIPESNPLIALLKTLKRHVRFATASYGLHAYILTPPSPLFTPSGRNLPSRIFSHLGGIGSDNVLHVAIQNDYLGLPTPESALERWAPQLYVLRDDLHLEVVCVIRGTQSLADIRTDLEASLQEVQLPSLHPDGGTETYRAHAGILVAARQLLDPEHSPLFSKLKTVLNDHPGYSLVLTGHSLGAAIASSLALLVGEYTAADLPTPTPATSSAPNPPPLCPNGAWTISASSGLPAGRTIRAICFAHPTTADVALAARCALGSSPLVLSVSLASDIVPRMGVPQVREVRRALGRLATTRRGFIGKSEGQHGKSEVLRSWWRWKQLGGGARGPGVTSRELAEIEEKAWKWRMEMETRAPGAGEDELMLLPAGRCLHLDRLPVGLELARKRQLEELMAEEEDEDDEEPQVWGLYEVADPRTFYACPLLEADLVKSHLPKVYLDAIEAL